MNLKNKSQLLYSLLIIAVILTGTLVTITFIRNDKTHTKTNAQEKKQIQQIKTNEKTFKIRSELSESLRSIHIELLNTLNENDTAKIKELSKNRKTALLKAAKEDANIAYEFILPTDKQQQLQNIDATIVETLTDYKGIVEVLAVEYKNGAADELYTLITSDKTRHNLYIADKEKKRIKSGDTLIFKGYKLDDRNILISAVNQSSELTVAESSSVPSSITGPYNTAVLMINFPNALTSSVTKTKADTIVFANANNYFKESSYLKTSITGSTFGFFTLGVNQTCDSNTLLNEAIKAADATVNFANYKSIVLTGPFGNDCGWGGMGSVGQWTVMTDDGTLQLGVTWVPDDSFIEAAGIGIVTHELGHNMGLNHSGFLNCIDVPVTEGCNWVNYGDSYTLMGSNAGHVTALYKEFLGWFAPSNIQTVTSNGTYTIEPTETNTAGIKALKIPRTNGYAALYIEYIQPIGQDVLLDLNGTSDIYKGATIRTHQGDPSRSSLLDMTSPVSVFETSTTTSSLLPGQTYTDPATLTKITVNSATSNALNVTVTLGSGDTTLPTGAITTPANNSAINGGAAAFPIIVNASDNSRISRVEFYVYNNIIGTDFFTPFTSNAFSDNSFVQGSSTIYAKIFDAAGNMIQTPTNSITNNASDTTAPAIKLTSPLANSFNKGTMQFSANASDNTGVAKVEFWLNGALYEVDTTAPYSVPLDTTKYDNVSSIPFYAVAYDAAGNAATTPTIIFSTDNFAPFLDVTTPTANATVKGTIAINASSSDGNDGSSVTKVEFYIDNILHSTDTTSPYSASWNTTTSISGAHTINVKSYDLAGNIATLKVPVTVNNTTVTPTPTPTTSINLLKNPGFELDSNADGKPDSWAANTHFTRFTNVKRSGSYSGRHTGTDNASYNTPQIVTGLQANTPYKFSGWVNISATPDIFTFKIVIVWRNSTQNVIRTNIVKTYTTATSGWNNASATFTSPPNTTNANVRMEITSLSKTIYVDDFILNKL